jgi:hypothetical protein
VRVEALLLVHHVDERRWFARSVHFACTHLHLLEADDDHALAMPPATACVPSIARAAGRAVVVDVEHRNPGEAELVTERWPHVESP